MTELETILQLVIYLITGNGEKFDGFCQHIYNNISIEKTRDIMNLCGESIDKIIF